MIENHQRDQLAQAIATVEFSRQTHVEWAAYLRQHPDRQPSAIGDAEYHDRAICEYDNVLAVLDLVNPTRCPTVEPCAHYRAAIGATIAATRVRTQLEDRAAALRTEEDQ